jgi:hypothetical protein
MTTTNPADERKRAWDTSSETQHQAPQPGRVVGETRCTTNNINKSSPYSSQPSSSNRRSKDDIAVLKELILGGSGDGGADETVATELSFVSSQGSSTTTTSTSTNSTTTRSANPSAQIVTGNSGNSSAGGNPAPRLGGELPGDALECTTRVPRHSLKDIQYLEDLVLQGDEDYQDEEDAAEKDHEEKYNDDTALVTEVKGNGGRRTSTPNERGAGPRIAREENLNVPGGDDDDAPYKVELTSCAIVSSPSLQDSTTTTASWSADQQHNWDTGTDTVIDAAVEIYSPNDHPEGLNQGRGNPRDGIEATSVSHVLGFAFAADENGIGLTTCCRCHPCGKKKWLLAMILTAVLMGLIVTTLGIWMRGNSEGDNGTKTSMRSWESDARYPEMLQVFERVSDPVAFADPISPQYQALNWLVYEDQQLLAISDPNLLQRYALLVLAFATGGANWRAVDPWEEQYTGHECTSFQALVCNDDGEVIRLHLWFRRLTGYLPPEIGLLTALTYFEVTRNSLEGTIPEQLYHLTNLGTLVRSSSDIQPERQNILSCHLLLLLLLLLLLFVCGVSTTIIERLDLSVNQFSSTISPSIAKLTRMQTLLLSQTLLSGSLPSSMMQMTNLSKSLSLYSRDLYDND